MNIILQNEVDIPQIEALLDMTFGQERFHKAAYVFRDGVDAVENLSFIIKDKGELVATLRFWITKVMNFEVLLLGPIAVHPTYQGKGYGLELMRYGLEQAKVHGHSRVVLVGDERYYSKLGFSRSCAQNIHMPGQIDESRLLALELIEGAFQGVSGDLSKVSL